MSPVVGELVGSVTVDGVIMPPRSTRALLFCAQCEAIRLKALVEINVFAVLLKTIVARMSSNDFFGVLDWAKILLCFGCNIGHESEQSIDIFAINTMNFFNDVEVRKTVSADRYKVSSARFLNAKKWKT